jgi:GMP synthase (glutamine-hydrolysing)
MPRPRRQPILIILHRDTSTYGRLGLRLQERGYVLDVRRPLLGDLLPETLEQHSGCVIFGGPQSANDEDEPVRKEIDWLKVPLREEKPFLGICLGAQMLAKHLGAEVSRHPEGLVERGYYPIYPTEAGKKLIEWPEYVQHFHKEGFSVPHGATLLARGEVFKNQAFSYGPAAFAIQFHIELTLAMVHRWMTRSAFREPQPGEQHRVQHIEHRWVHDHQTVTWTDRFLDLWLAPRAARPAMLPAAE